MQVQRTPGALKKESDLTSSRYDSILIPPLNHR